MPDHHHRSGPLRQTNKKNKRNKSSKRSLSRAARGKLAGRKSSVMAAAAQSKADRKNMQQQRRNAKRQELMKQRRGLAGVSPPSRLVGIVSLGANHEIEHRVRNMVLEKADRVIQPHQASDATISCKFDGHRKEGHLTLLTVSAFGHYGNSEDGYIMAALDLARVCDMVLFVVDANGPRVQADISEIHIGDDPSATAANSSRNDYDNLISERGDRILAALKAQGIPTPVTVLAHTEKDVYGEEHMTMQTMKSHCRSTVKRHLELKKFMTRFATTEFGTENDKVVEINLFDQLDDEEEEVDSALHVANNTMSTESFVRMLCTSACSPPKWVSKTPRSYILSDTFSYDANSRELSLRGYIRGFAPMDVNSLFHIPGVGAVTCKAVTKTHAPLAVRHKGAAAIGTIDETIIPNPSHQESLDMFATPDALQGEQNLIGFDESDEFDEDEKFARPAGWSDYQSVWLDGMEGDELGDDEDHGELAAELNRKPDRLDTLSVVPDDRMDLDDANDVTKHERAQLLEQRRRVQEDNEEFPDEVDVGEDEKASDRFARYRSLKSFRKSFWDPKENLPETYASIFHFSSFRATQRSIMNDMKDVVRAAGRAEGSFFGKSPATDGVTIADDSEDDYDPLDGCVPSGTYVTMTFENVTTDALRHVSSHALLTAVSLLEHENKVSVLHMSLNRSICCDALDDPIKSKDVLTFRCGWRTWQARPVFSQNNLNSDKHMFERFMPKNGTFFAASVFGPVTYTPCPILVFRGNAENNKRELVAIGSMIGADAERIVLKRVVLTGYPVRVHKRHATVKYMFYNPDDVRWFKPAGLYTKHGLEGQIIESVGEHGTMKCLFNMPIKQHDTVCLPLYKRIYPKFASVEGDRTQSGKYELLVR